MIFGFFDPRPGLELGPADGAHRVPSEPRVGALLVEPVAATRDQPSRLLSGHLLEADGALRPRRQLLPGDPRQLRELLSRQASASGRLVRPAPVIVARDVPEEADVEREPGAHAGERKRESQEHREEHVPSPPWDLLFSFIIPGSCCSLSVKLEKLFKVGGPA